MENQILNKILEKLELLESEVKQANHRLENMETVQQQIIQAVIETNDIVKRLEQSQRKTEAELNNHSYSLDILNREQFYLKTEIEKLKNR
mgnify:FL=1